MSRGTGDADRLETAWAAACALAPTSINEATALALRPRLGLPPAPWALPALRAEAAGPAGRLQWPHRLRARRLNWLCAAEAGGVTAGSQAGRALDFFEHLYDRQLRGGTADSPARRHLKMERALVRLWRGAGDAVRELYRLHSGALRHPIRDHLGALAAAGAGGGGGRVQLPWRWGDRSPAEQVMLQQMGFGGVEAPARLRRPGRLWLGLGLCAGLAGAALAVAVRSFEPLADKPVIVRENQPPEAPLERIEEMADGRWWVSIASRKWSAEEEVDAGSRVTVSWDLTEHGCVDGHENGGEIWRCGGLESPPRLPEGITGSQVVLEAAPGEEGAEELAIALLDSGSADTVLIWEDPAADSWWIGSGRSDRQLIGFAVDSEAPASGIYIGATNLDAPVATELSASPRTGLIVASDWDVVTEALEFNGIRPLGDISSESFLMTRSISDPAPLLRGLGGCSPTEETEDNSIVFVRVCPGTFLMGSPEDEEGRWDAEGPQHQVTLSEYWIAKTEVTNEQYQRRRGQPPSRYLGERTDLPVENVTWFQARDFCKDLGYRLPTEAEWEYAARAGTQTRWSFGNDERDLERYAWFGDNSDNRPHPVGEKEPNQWGLHDMHGNVYEWVGDYWLDAYPEDPQSDPTGPGDGSLRVLRGGSFFGSPRYLRSAFRGGFQPEFRDWVIGFRCVRSPRRQP